MSSKNLIKCRLCLVETEVNKTYELFKNSDNVMFKIENDQNDEFSNLKLYEKVEYCCGVRLHNKEQMPTRICGKCFNTVHMWFNFRQMCYNSQVFLITQNQEVVDIDHELEDLHTIRSNLKGQKIDDMVEDINPNNQSVIDFEADEYVETHFNDDDDYVVEVGRKENEPIVKNREIDNAKIKVEEIDEFYVDNGDLLENLTADDFNEAMDYLNAEDDQQLEEFIEHCATQNLSIKQLNAKAMTRNKPKVVRRRPYLNKTEKEQKKAVRLPKPSTFMCNICGNVYGKKPLFQHHMRMHSDVKPYQCEICNKSYRIMSDLRNHMYRHTGEKPFKCKYCDRHFMDRSSRHRHERIHTNSRPYRCNICSKSFSYSAILKNHLKLHSGEKDYVCTICNKSFTLAHQLKAHMLTISHKQKEAAYEASGYKILYETTSPI